MYNTTIFVNNIKAILILLVLLGKIISDLLFFFL